MDDLTVTTDLLAVLQKHGFQLDEDVNGLAEELLLDVIETLNDAGLTPDHEIEDFGDKDDD